MFILLLRMKVHLVICLSRAPESNDDKCGAIHGWLGRNPMDPKQQSGQLCLLGQIKGQSQSSEHHLDEFAKGCLFSFPITRQASKQALGRPKASVELGCSPPITENATRPAISSGLRASGRSADPFQHGQPPDMKRTMGTRSSDNHTDESSLRFPLERIGNELLRSQPQRLNDVPLA
jgi:hypothetical protein